MVVDCLIRTVISYAYRIQVAGNRFVEVAFPFPVCFFDGTITIAFLIVASKYAVLSVDLLDLDLIRADEVWFVEKGHEGASHLTSLAEYKPREDIRKGYLQGRYGAIPFFAPVSSLKW